jgi:hypothetical protein
VKRSTSDVTTSELKCYQNCYTGGDILKCSFFGLVDLCNYFWYECFVGFGFGASHVNRLRSGSAGPSRLTGEDLLTSFASPKRL